MSLHTGLESRLLQEENVKHVAGRLWREDKVKPVMVLLFLLLLQVGARNDRPWNEGCPPRLAEFIV